MLICQLYAPEIAQSHGILFSPPPLIFILGWRGGEFLLLPAPVVGLSRNRDTLSYHRIPARNGVVSRSVAPRAGAGGWRPSLAFARPQLGYPVSQAPITNLPPLH